MPDTAFQRLTRRMDCLGIDLNRPVDSVKPGRFPYMKNCRSYQAGRIEPRNGLTDIGLVVPGQNEVHSMRRLNDQLNARWARIIGAGTYLAWGTYAPNQFLDADSGYSGNPLALVPWRPDQSPISYMYVGDSARMRKITAEGLVDSIGYPPPMQAPVVELSPAPKYVLVDDFQSLTWARGAIPAHAPPLMTENTATPPYLISSPQGGGEERTRGLIQYIVFDNGAAPGWCDIVLDSMINPALAQPGALPTVGEWLRLSTDLITPSPGDETVVVQAVYPGAGVQATAQAPINILGVLYDQLNHLDGSFYLTAPVDLVEVDGLIHNITNGEVTRILAVISGPDGTTSPRLSTLQTWNPGDQVEILPCFRCYCTLDHAVGIIAHADAIGFSGGVALIGGVTQGTGNAWIDKSVDLDLSKIAPGLATQSEDQMTISLWVDHPENVIEIKVQLDVDAIQNDFTQNYYSHSIRPSDITAALMNIESSVTTRQIVVQNNVSNQPIPVGNKTVNLDAQGNPISEAGLLMTGFPPTTTATSNNAVSQQLASGQTVWSAVAFHVSDLTRVGTDNSRTLANVKALRVLMTVTGSVVLHVDSWWLGGGYGPDTLAATTTPYLYRYRVRNPTTGVSSNPSPVSRNGRRPFRQSIDVQPWLYVPPDGISVAENDLVVDIERFGGAIAEWHYIGTLKNTLPLLFTDVLPDDTVATLAQLGEDMWQPWPIIQAPRQGEAVATAGTLVQDGNASFDMSWMPGTEIMIDKTPFTIYRMISTSLLETVENTNYHGFVSWNMPEPTRMGQPLYALWGDEQLGAFFACGDPVNPGRLYFSVGNNPDNTAEGNYLDITSASEPLMNGVVYNLRSYVFSSERMFQILRTGNATVPWSAQEIPNGKGLFARWAITREPATMLCLLGKDGLYSTTGGAAFALTDAELYPLLPNEGNPGEDTNGILAPYISADTERYLRLTYYDEFLYFDYPVALPPPPPPGPLRITTASLPDAIIGVAYSATLQASGGVPPYTWAAVPSADGTSALPPGLAISSAGVISGTPTATGHFGFSVLAVDSTSASVSIALSITSNEPGGGVGLLQITTAPVLRSAVVGTPYSLALSASGGTTPYHWAASALPAGLSLSAGGIISGTPTIATTASFTVQLTDSTTPTALQVSKTFQLLVSALPLLTITTSSLPEGTVGSPYSVVLAVTGGQAPYTWSLASGSSLPAGLTLSPQGVISGTPTASITLASFVIVVFDAANESTQKAFQISITPLGGPLTFTTATIPNATTSIPYSFSFGVSGGVPPYNFTLVSGDQLPPGLSLSANGVLNGTPTVGGSTAFGVNVTDSTGQGLSVRFTMTVVSAVPPMITTPTLLPSATVGAVYSLQFAATSGTPGYTWAAVSSLPPGFALSATGLLSGTPTTAGNNSFSVRVTDSAGQSATAGFSLAVNPAGSLSITTTSLPSAMVGSPYSANLTASGGTPPYNWTLVTVNGLPGGLAMNSAGGISGTPSGFGLFSFTVEVTDSGGLASSAQFSISVQNPGIALTITSSSPLPNATVGVPYSQSLAAIGGTPPYTWSVGVIGVPGGFSLSPSGLFSGTFAAPTTTSFSAVVTDSASNSAAAVFVVTALAAARSTAAALRQLPAPRAAGGGMATLILATDVGATERGSAPGGWFWDVYAQQVLFHYGEEGPGVHALLMGGGDGHLYGYAGCDDAGQPFPMEFTTPSEDGGDLRSFKLYQDIMLDANTDSLDAIVTPWVDSNKAPLGTTTVNTGVRDQVSIPLGMTPPLARDMSAIESRNLSLNVVVMIRDCRRPMFYAWEPRWTASAAPLASGLWQINTTSSGLPNWKWFGIFRISYVSTGPVDVDIWLDPGGRQPTITLPSSNNDYHMQVFRVPVMKFKLWYVRVAARSSATTETPGTGTFRLDTHDSYIEIKEWGSNDAYRHFRVLDDYAMLEG